MPPQPRRIRSGDAHRTPQFQKEELLASLLIFRVLYFMLPFCAAVLILSAREGWLASKITADKAYTAHEKSPIILKQAQR